jgi:hypothetical protein
MPEQAEAKQSVDIIKAIDKLADDAYNRSGLRTFYAEGCLQLSDSVQFLASKRLAPSWNCCPTVNLYGCLSMDSSFIFSIANSLGLFSELMNDDLSRVISDFISNLDHYDFYNFEDSPSNADEFYSVAYFDNRPARLSLICSPYFGTYQDSFVYLLAGDACCFGSYDNYYEHFFLRNLSTILKEVVSDESKVRGILSYLEDNRSKIIRWFELVDENFLSAFEELEKRFDVFLKTLFRVG